MDLTSWTPRPAQSAAVSEIVSKFQAGADVVLLDAPVGSGKTLISCLVKEALGARKMSYVAHSHDLQDQFMGDFAEARTLKGRKNYPTGMPGTTAADCSGKSCGLCEGGPSKCAYQVAKLDAVTGEVAVLNTAYMLSFPGGQFVGRPYVVIDECDVLEKCMLGHYELYLSARRLTELNVRSLKKGVHEKTVQGWMRDEVLRSLSERRVRDLGYEGEKDTAWVRRAERNARDWEAVKKALADMDEGRAWVRDYPRNQDAFVMKPVRVGELGGGLLWERGKGTKWLCMSGSFGCVDEWVESVGVEECGLEWDVVQVPMTWEKGNRPIVVKGVANMRRAELEESTPKVIEFIAELMQGAHKGENCLVHAVNYQLTQEITAGLRARGVETMSYTSGDDRAWTLKKFKEYGGVIVAPSLDRGVDLPDDLCRVVVVAKMPYAGLGDRQVSERMNGPGGEVWYANQTARSLIQMVGRGVRHEDDRCAIYILDAGFGMWYGKWGWMLPKWFKDAIVGQLPRDWKISS